MRLMVYAFILCFNIIEPTSIEITFWKFPVSTGSVAEVPLVFEQLIYLNNLFLLQFFKHCTETLNLQVETIYENNVETLNEDELALLTVWEFEKRVNRTR